jgi:hypothetical protein
MHLRPDHIRALAAAAGLVGRPRLRAGLLLTLAAGCNLEVVDPGGATADAGSTAAPDSTGALDPSTGVLTTIDASTGGATSTDSTTSSATTLESTGGGTLLTDATTFASTGTGDESTGGDTGDSSGSTGGLGDCVDPRSGMTDWECCEAQGWQPHPQCTPWGPPAPPAATTDRLRRARAARGRFV